MFLKNSLSVVSGLFFIKSIIGVTKGLPITVLAAAGVATVRAFILLMSAPVIPSKKLVAFFW